MIKLKADLFSYDLYFENKYGKLPTYEYVYMHRMTENLPLVIAFNDTKDHSTRVENFNTFDLSKYKERIVNLDVLNRDLSIVDYYGIENIKLIKPSGELKLINDKINLSSGFTDMYFDTHQHNWDRNLEPKNQSEKTLTPVMRINPTDNMFNMEYVPKSKKRFNLKDKKDTGYMSPKQRFKFIIENPASVGTGQTSPNDMRETSPSNRYRPAPTEKPQSRNLEDNVEWLQKLSFKLNSDAKIYKEIPYHYTDINRPPQALIDFDGTISQGPGRNLSEPFDGAKEALQKLKDSGIQIIINTARGDLNNVKEYLDWFKISYDYINCNPYQTKGVDADCKLKGDILVDDKALHFDGKWSDDFVNEIINNINKNREFITKCSFNLKSTELGDIDINEQGYQLMPRRDFPDGFHKRPVTRPGEGHNPFMRSKQPGEGLSKIPTRDLTTKPFFETNPKTIKIYDNKQPKYLPKYKFGNDEGRELNWGSHLYSKYLSELDKYKERLLHIASEVWLKKGISKKEIADKWDELSDKLDKSSKKEFIEIYNSYATELYGPYENFRKRISSKIIFDNTRTDMPLYDNMLKDKEYYEKNKGITYDIRYMSPIMYLEYVSNIVGASGPFSIIYEEHDSKKLENLKQKSERGISFPMPILDFVNNSQEGRHRAILAYEKNISRIPVMIIDSIDTIKKEEGLNPQPHYYTQNIYPYKGTGPGFSSPTMYDNTDVMTREVRVAKESKTREFSKEEAKAIGDTLGIDWGKIDLEQFRMGLSVELEHGTIDPDTNVTDDDLLMTGKIAWIHLKEVSDYYTKLKKVESFKLKAYKLQDVLAEQYGLRGINFEQFGSMLDYDIEYTEASIIACLHGKPHNIINFANCGYQYKGNNVHAAASLKLYSILKEDKFSRFFTVEDKNKILNWAENILRQYDSRKSFKLAYINIEKDKNFKHTIYSKLSAKNNGKEIGYLLYDVDDNTIYIKAIKVDEDSRRQHIATSMVNFIKNEFPNKNIDWGTTTTEGEHLKKNIEDKKSFKLIALDKPSISQEAYDAFSEKSYVFKNYQLSPEQIEDSIEKGKDLSIILKHQKLGPEQKKRAIQRALEKGVALVYIWEKEKENLSEDQVKYLISKLHKKAMDDGTNIIYLLKNFELAPEQKDVLITRALKDGIGLHYMFKNRLLSPEQRAFAVKKAIETGYGLLDLLKYENLTEDQRNRVISKCIERGVALIYLLEKEKLNDAQKKVIFDKALREGVGYNYILKRYKLSPEQVALAIRRSKHIMDNLKYILKFQELTTEQKQYIENRIEIEKQEREKQRLHEMEQKRSSKEEDDSFMVPYNKGFEELQMFFRDATDEDVMKMYDLIESEKNNDAKKLLESFIGYEI